MRMRNIIILCVALIMGGLAAFLARNWLLSHSRSSSAATGTIVVAAKPLGYGAAVTADNIAEIPWAARALPEGAFVTKEELLGDGRRVVLTPLASNEPVLRSKITGPGYREVLLGPGADPWLWGHGAGRARRGAAHRDARSARAHRVSAAGRAGLHTQTGQRSRARGAWVCHRAHRAAPGARRWGRCRRAFQAAAEHGGGPLSRGPEGGPGKFRHVVPSHRGRQRPW